MCHISGGDASHGHGGVGIRWENETEDKTMAKYVSLCLLLVVGIAPRVYGAVWYVDRGNATGTEDGHAWGTAFTTLQEGLNAAAAAGGGEVWVVRGTYGEERPNAFGAVILKGNVGLYGGFVGNETELAQRDVAAIKTVIDGSAVRDGLPAYHVVIGADGAIMDGFSITGGRADGTDEESHGEELFINDTEPTVRNCVFTTAHPDADTGTEGSVYIEGSSCPDIEMCVFIDTPLGIVNDGCGSISGCLFEETTALREQGSGLSMQGVLNNGNCGFYECVFKNMRKGAVTNGYNAYAALSQCIFLGNSSAKRGAGFSTVNAGYHSISIQECLFVRNASATEGGGVAFYEYAGHDWQTRVLERSCFYRNSAVSGGAVSVDCEFSKSNDTYTLSGCAFLKNVASTAGGAIYINQQYDTNMLVANCYLNGNSAPNGGGVYADVAYGFPEVSFTNCTLRSNWADLHGGGFYISDAYPTLTNCIAWNDSPEEISSDHASSFLFSDVWGGGGGTGSINQDPVFSESFLSGAGLRASSPCVDSGSAAIPASVLPHN